MTTQHPAAPTTKPEIAHPPKGAWLAAWLAIALWASLASLGLKLAHVPPFLLTGLALILGSALSLPVVLRRRSAWAVSLPQLGLGVYGLFGFHFLLFMALRHAPPVEANLVNYLWPLLIVLLAPVLVPGVRYRLAHLIGGVMGLAGASVALLGASSSSQGGGLAWGYGAAAASALVWASFTLLTRRLAQQGKAAPTSALGLMGLVSGVLALVCHVWLEPSVHLSMQDLALIAVMGLGPLGLAFMAWDHAVKSCPPSTLGVISYATPLASTVLLTFIVGRPFSVSLLVSTALIVGGGLLALRTQAQEPVAP